MFLKNYVFFYFCLIVFFIYAFNVRLSNCDNGPEEQHGSRDEFKAGDQASILEQLSKVIEVPPMPIITVSVPLVFEGVDYDLLKNQSAKIYDEYYDCYYWHTKCIRDGTYFHTVCAYHYSWSWVNFVNICQLELENCRHRVRVEGTWKTNEGIFGVDPYSKERNYYDYQYIHFYQGDGENCKYNKFRRQVPDDRVNFYYEDEQKAFEMEINSTMDNSTKNLIN